MNIWDVLEIEATTEVSAIKKAYARKLKIYHPEDDPEGYQRLREAYDSALKYATYNKPQKVEDTDTSDKSMERGRQLNLLKQQAENNLEDEGSQLHSRNLKLLDQETFNNIDNNRLHSLKNINYNPQDEILDDNMDNIHKANIFNEYVDESVKSEQVVDELFNRVEELYSNFFQRIEIKNWEKILNADIMWSLDYQEKLSKRMLSFLDEHRHIPQKILKLLDDNFHWMEQEDVLRSYCHADFITYFYKQISSEIGNRYCYFSPDCKIDYDKYLNYREAAFNSLAKNRLYDAGEYLSLAYAMYPNDPDLLCMMGGIYAQKWKWSECTRKFKAAINLNKEDMDTRLYQALIYFQYGKHKQAIKLCNFILKYKCDDIQARDLLGKSYLHLKKYYKSADIFMKNIKMMPSNIEARKSLYIIVDSLNKLRKKYPWDLTIKHNLTIINLVLEKHDRIENVKLRSIGAYSILKFINYLFVILLLIGILILGGTVVSGAPSCIVPFLFIVGFILRKKIRN